MAQRGTPRGKHSTPARPRRGGSKSPRPATAALADGATDEAGGGPAGGADGLAGKELLAPAPRAPAPVKGRGVAVSQGRTAQIARGGKVPALLARPRGADQDPGAESRGLSRDEGVPRKKRGGLGAMGKAAWEKSVPELSLLGIILPDPQPAPAAAAPAPPRAAAPVSTTAAAALPHGLISLLIDELRAITDLCEEPDEAPPSLH